MSEWNAINLTNDCSSSSCAVKTSHSAFFCKLKSYHSFIAPLTTNLSWSLQGADDSAAPNMMSTSPIHYVTKFILELLMRYGTSVRGVFLRSPLFHIVAEASLLLWLARCTPRTGVYACTAYDLCSPALSVFQYVQHTPVKKTEIDRAASISG